MRRALQCALKAKINNNIQNKKSNEITSGGQDLTLTKINERLLSRKNMLTSFMNSHETVFSRYQCFLFCIGT